MSVSQPGKQKKKFSSFFKSLVIELDKDLYGPDNHLVEVSASVLSCGGFLTFVQISSILRQQNQLLQHANTLRHYMMQNVWM